MSQTIPNHVPMSQFSVRASQLLIGEKSLDEIAVMLGKDVFYAYDSAVINQKIQQFRQNMPDRIKLHYAIKANPYPPLVGRMVGWVDGFDVASHREMLVALQSGMRLQRLVLQVQLNNYLSWLLLLSQA
ncbi:hypothetical protein ACFQMB_00815 [Pseudobowmanella zhangzhouensis]|uniref:hypothetical protein n=1 Tax=Pseudobowmanella zhangzhouensis TaxID=1537679 RepID=UPI00361DA78A